MAKAAYVPPTVEFGEGTETRAGNAHLRLPFGLCKKYGINLPKDATPRDAWNALKGIGIDPGEEYDKFADNADKDGEEKDTTPKASENESRADKVFSDSKDRFTYDSSFTQEYARGQFDAGDDYHKEVVLKALEDTKITYRHGAKDECYSYMGRVVLTVNNEYGDEKNSYEKGEVFYHETFHAIDGGYATRWGTMLSHTYTNEEGKTLYDVLKSEKRAFGSARIAEVKAAKEKDTDEWMVANNITTREAIDSIVKNWNEQQERINQFTDWRERDKVAHSDEYQKAYRDFNLLKSQRMVYGSRLNKKYGFISDIMSQWNESIGMGHTMSYWKRDKFNSSSEFFAEVGACGATNKAALEVVRKYFPKSVAFAEQLIDGIKTGNIKAR